jgi:hypothetical protein
VIARKEFCDELVHASTAREILDWGGIKERVSA